MLKIVSYIPVLFMLLSFIGYAQEERNDDLGDVSDDFQHHYFEALKQKGIENYGKAIDLLVECKNLAPNNASVHFELDNYSLAESSLKKALELKPNNQWVLKTLYLVYAAQHKDAATIATLQQLTGLHEKYNDELISYYFKNRQYDEALALIDQIDAKSGINRKRERLRNQIYLYGQKFEEQTQYLQKKITAQTATEGDYINLIYAYSRINKPETGFATAKQFQKAYPNSDKPHLSLYKFYLNNKQVDAAVLSMHRVTKSTTLKNSEKYKVVNDFLSYSSQHKEYLPEVEKAMETYQNPTLLSKLALLYENNKDAGKSTVAIDTDKLSASTKFEDLKVLGALLLKKNKIADAIKTSSKALELYPAQPVFYLQQGKAYNLNKEPKKALESLTFGLDYLIDDVKTEVEFYLEMAKAYEQLNDTKNQQKFLIKAQKLNK